MLRLAAGRRRVGSSERDMSSAPAWGTLRGWRSRMAGAESVRAVPERVERSAVAAAVQRDSGDGGSSGTAGQLVSMPAGDSVVPGRPRSRMACPAVPLSRCPALPKPVRPGQERIGEPLDADGRVRTMPAVNDRRVGQREQLGLDACHEGSRVATGQVGPAYRPVEQHVAAEDHTLTHESRRCQANARG